MVQRADLRRGLLLLALFALATPLGILLGWALLTFAAPIVSVVFSALAGGTFLYIGSAEVVISEFATRKPKLGRFLFFSLGIVVVAATSLAEQLVLLN